MAATNITVLTDRGQVSVPAGVRREMHLEPGARLVWERVSDREIRVVVIDDKPRADPLSAIGFARRL